MTRSNNNERIRLIRRVADTPNGELLVSDVGDDEEAMGVRAALRDGLITLDQRDGDFARARLTTTGTFDAAVEAHFRKMGAKDNVGHLSFMYPLRLATLAGDLLVDMNGTWVAMRFVQVDSAKKLLPHCLHDRLNQFSGKYNVEFSDEECANLICVTEMINSLLEAVRKPEDLGWHPDGVDEHGRKRWRRGKWLVSAFYNRGLLVPPSLVTTRRKPRPSGWSAEHDDDDAGIEGAPDPISAGSLKDAKTRVDARYFRTTARE